MISSVYENGYWWVIIPDELWNNKELLDYYEGIPLYVRR